MSASIRAHRILKKLPLYVDRSADSTKIFSERFPELGLLVGVYKNRENEEGPVSIYENGLSWRLESAEIFVEYRNISSVELPQGKDSRALVLKMVSSERLWLPVTGGDGAFRDSLAFLRFLDRVLAEQSAS